MTPGLLQHITPINVPLKVLQPCVICIPTYVSILSSWRLCVVVCPVTFPSGIKWLLLNQPYYVNTLLVN